MAETDAGADGARAEDVDRTDPRPGRGAVLGTNQSGMRDHNERLALTLIRRHGALSRAEIARETGLSAQTVSVILRGLEADGLIERGRPTRGRIGQPSVPMRLAPGGAYVLGLKVGRRSVEMVLTDFLGAVRAEARAIHPYPTPEGTLDFARSAAAQLSEALAPAERDRIAGLGIGLPGRLWDWAEPLGVPTAAMEAWRDADIRAALAAEMPWPVLQHNDASAACHAELVFGTEAPRDFLYAYVGFFAGGGLVLNGALVGGPTGNAAALGSLLVPGPGGARQLLHAASLAVLERRIGEAGGTGARIWEATEGWDLDEGVLGPWLACAAESLAHAAAAGAALLDLEVMLIDGWMPAALRARLTEAVAAALAALDLSGIAPPAIRAGTIGPRARTLGAASLPLAARFLVRPGQR